MSTSGSKSRGSHSSGLLVAEFLCRVPSLTNSSFEPTGASPVSRTCQIRGITVAWCCRLFFAWPIAKAHTVVAAMNAEIPLFSRPWRC